MCRELASFRRGMRVGRASHGQMDRQTDGQSDEDRVGGVLLHETETDTI